jgi:hypothetical protein
MLVKTQAATIDRWITGAPFLRAWKDESCAVVLRWSVLDDVVAASIRTIDAFCTFM